MANNDFIDEVMGFNPSNLSAFEEPQKANFSDAIYKTNPVTLSKSDDGHYHAKVRIIYNPFDVKHSIVNQTTYAMNDANGFFMVKSKLADNQRDCEIFSAWKRLWFSKDNQEVKREYCKKMFQKTESRWVLVQIIEDDNQPELVGQFKAWKLPKDVFEKLQAKMHPSVESKKVPVALMDYLFGPLLELDVQPGPDDKANPGRKQREISYSLCEFDTDVYPIIRRDGTPLFNETEVEIVENYDNKRKELAKAKTDAKKSAIQEELNGMTDALRELYSKAITYLKSDEAHVIDIVKECGYQPWTPEVKARVDNWLAIVANMGDPTQEAAPAPQATPQASPEQVGPAANVQAFDPMAAAMGPSNEDMPF